MMKLHRVIALALALAFGSSSAFGQASPGTSPLSILKGGTGAITPAAARINLGFAATANRLYGTDGSGVSTTVTMPAAGLTLSAGSIAFANDLAALEGLSSTGIARRTGTDTWSVGTTVSNAELATAGAATLKGNPTSGTAAVTDFTIQGLTARGAPDASNDKIPLYDNAAGTIKYVTPSQISAAGTLPTIANNQLLANISGGAAAPSATSPSSLWDSFCSTTIGNIWVRQTGGWGCLALGYANPVWWGADPTGAADSATAFNSAIATALPVRWPKGTFKVNSQITTTLAGAFDCFCMSGAGIGMTSLNWPNATGGIQVTGTTTGGSGVSHNVVDIYGLKLTTSQAGGGNAFKMLNGGNVNTPTSVIRDVVIQGDDYSQGSGSHYWSVDIYSHNWPNLIIDRVTGNGKWVNPLTTAAGIGVIIEGDAATASYTNSIKMTNCNFGYHQNAVQLNSYWQGVLINQCNFSGNSVINVPVAQTGTLNQITISNSIFYAENDAVELNTFVIQPQFFGNNVIIAGAAGAGGFVLGTSSQTQAIGNVIVGQGATSSGNGISTTGPNGLFIGNQFSSVTTGIFLAGPSSTSNCSQNVYASVTNKCFNSGTSNSVGVATE